MPWDEKTRMGGPKESFETTRIADILAAKTPDPDRQREALGTILAQYWKPVYCYLWRKGFGNEAAKDLTQGFFEKVVLGRKLIGPFDPAKGRFRTYLLTALDRYVASVRRAESAEKRQPHGGLLRLDGMESSDIPSPAGRASPEDAFAYAWALELLKETLDAVAAHCRRKGQAKHWEVFRLTVVEPTLTGAEAPPLSRLCAELGIRGEAKASNMNTTVKRRFQAVLRSRVRQFVAADDEVEGEIRQLMEILSKCGAGS